MIRTVFACAWTTMLLAGAGCQKSSEEPPRAQVALGNLMPGEPTGFEAAYVADQRQVKFINREVSFEPLDTFRDRAAAEAKKAASSKKKSKTKRGKTPAKKQGLFGRFKAGFTEKVGRGLATTGLPVGRFGNPDATDDLDPDDEEGDDLEDEDDLDEEEEEEDEDDLEDEDEEGEDEDDLDDAEEDEDSDDEI